MNIITRILKRTFNFFCGDWRIFWGIFITIVLVKLIVQLPAFSVAIPLAGILYISGISLSLIVALNREISK